MNVEVVLRGRVRPQNCLAGALPKAVPRSSFGWHDCSTCSSFCLAGTMPKAFLTEPHAPAGGASWAGASSKLLGRSITTAYLDLPLADMIAARVLLSAWHARCQRHSWQSPMDLEVVPRGRVRPQNCLAGALPKAIPGSSFGWHDSSMCSSFGKRNARSSLVGSSVQIVCCIALARQKGKFKLLQACQPKEHQRRHWLGMLVPGRFENALVHQAPPPKHPCGSVTLHFNKGCFWKYDATGSLARLMPFSCPLMNHNGLWIPALQTQIPSCKKNGFHKLFDSMVLKPQKRSKSSGVVAAHLLKNEAPAPKLVKFNIWDPNSAETMHLLLNCPWTSLNTVKKVEKIR